MVLSSYGHMETLPKESQIINLHLHEK